MPIEGKKMDMLLNKKKIIFSTQRIYWCEVDYNNVILKHFKYIIVISILFITIL